MLVRTRRFYNDAEIVLLYKSDLLAFQEYRTLRIYHTEREMLRRLDRIQSKSLDDGAIHECDALIHFSLASLTTRRDITMMGVLHRTMIGLGPSHFKKHFKIEPGRTFKDPRQALKGPLAVRSILGLVAVYNFLPEDIRAKESVKDF